MNQEYDRVFVGRFWWTSRWVHIRLQEKTLLLYVLHRPGSPPTSQKAAKIQNLHPSNSPKHRNTNLTFRCQNKDPQTWNKKPPQLKLHAAAVTTESGAGPVLPVSAALETPSLSYLCLGNASRHVISEEPGLSSRLRGSLHNLNIQVNFKPPRTLNTAN